MKQNNEPKSFGEIFSQRQITKSPAYPWQQLALEIIGQLGVPADKKNSVFLLCKKYSRLYLEKCLNETKELCSSGESWKYFFKVVEANKQKTGHPLKASDEPEKSADLKIAD